jgi:hypothetical protein
MSDALSAPPPLPEFKNRRPGLIGCGVVHLLFGLMFIGFSVLMVLMRTVMAKSAAPQAAMPAGLVVYTSLFYLVLASLFVTLGIGSMMARRWAPPLIQVTSWAWLVFGVLGGGMMFFMLPKMLATLPNQQPGAAMGAMGCMAVGFVLFGIAVPLSFVLFYRSLHVKTTVEILDPVPRWTDQQPVSMLIFASWMFFGAISTLLSSFMYRALPIGGFMLRGPALFAVMAVMATLLFWIGVGTLKRLPAAWWSGIVLMIIGVTWGAFMVRSATPEKMSEAMGIPYDAQQAAITQALYSSPFFFVWMAVLWLGYLVFLLYIRRYFFPRSEGAAVQAPVDLQ